MECPSCHTKTQPGQKFCGTCGHKLEKDCPKCGASNPPDFNFCTRCGHNLGTSGSIALVRSGLIAEVDAKASALIGHLSEEMAGKPFSLFVAREDLAVFYAHWNELLNNANTQVLELALNHKKGKKIYVLLECTAEKGPAAQAHLIHLNLNDISSRRLALDRLQQQQDLLNLIYTLADKVYTVSSRHLDAAIVNTLKQICLFIKADRCFIYSINRSTKRLEISHHWCQPSCRNAGTKSRSVPLSMIRRSIVRLRKERSYLVDNVARLTPAERYEQLAWHQADLAAVMCHLIYARKRPMGIIGAARYKLSSEWSSDAISLIKLFGQIAGNLLPFAAEEAFAAETSEAQTAGVSDNHERLGRNGPKSRTKEPKTAGSHSESLKDEPQIEESKLKSSGTAPPSLPDPGRPMRLETHSGGSTSDQQTVFAREDDLIILACPHCGIQESVSLGQFEKLGNAVDVECNCHKHFTAVLEKRRAYRKAVHLEGFFTIAGEYGPNDTKGTIWGRMVVKNLSKTGLRFFSKRVDLLRPGDTLMVRFNLDNSNNALIHKQAQVVSIHDQEVGCRFQGADQYDITLGFYFI